MSASLVFRGGMATTLFPQVPERSAVDKALHQKVAGRRLQRDAHSFMAASSVETSLKLSTETLFDVR